MYRCSLLSSMLAAAHVACDSEWVTVSFYSAFWMSTEIVYWQIYLVVAWLVSRETAAVSAQVLCTSHNNAPDYSVTSFKAA